MQLVFKRILKVSLFAFVCTGLLGFYFLSVGQEVPALYCAKAGGLVSTLFTAIVIVDILTVKGFPISTRLIWIVTLFAFQILAGIGYYFLERKSLTQQPV